MEEDRICGANAVAALFARRPDAVQRLFYTEAMREVAGPLCARLARVRRPYRMMPADELARTAGTAHHGGICAVATARDVPLLDGASPPQHRFLLALDGVGNPHNLGAIARSAAFFGVRALLLLDKPGAAMPSDAAYRVAEGGLEYLDLYRTGDLARAVRVLQPWYRSVAATLGGEGVPPRDLPLDRPTLLVLGHEEDGVSPGVLAVCRRQVRVTPRGAVQSLNVAQAAAVLLYALAR
jgi:TrmH RNA methyltransferase